MNDLNLPQTPQTTAQLTAAITDMLSHVADPDASLGIETSGYGKCVEAMWRAGYMAVEYVARELGVTGFQHSVAALTLYGQSMHINGPYMVLKLEDALYPQYDLPARMREFLDRDDSRQWLADEARKRLADDREYARDAVVEHWQKLAAAVSPKPKAGAS